MGTNTEIISKLVKDEIFGFTPSKSSPWWKVFQFSGHQGFVHKSRIHSLKKMSDKEQRTIIVRILDAELAFAQNKAKSYEIRDQWRAFHDIQFVPLLDFFSSFICKRKDIELLNIFMDILVAEEGSADESPSFALGEIYLCQPDWTLKLVKQRKSEIINGHLEWGFKNVASEKEDYIKNFQELKKNLEDL